MKNLNQHYDELKAAFLSNSEKQNLRSVMFTGCTRGDGVSTTAIGFAKALALSSRGNIVFIDFDSSESKVSNQIRSLEKGSGMIDRPRTGFQGHQGQESLPFHNGKLHIISYWDCWSAQESSHEPARFGQMLENLLKSYTYIIIDSPPVLGDTESLSVSGIVDAVILVIGSGMTRREVAKKAVERIKDEGGNIIGVVLNRRRYYIPAVVYKFFFGY